MEKKHTHQRTVLISLLEMNLRELDDRDGIDILKGKSSVSIYM